MTVKKPGPPKKGEEKREDLVMVNFKADKETLSYLSGIEAELKAKGVWRGRSAAVRWAIACAYMNLVVKKPKNELKK